MLQFKTSENKQLNYFRDQQTFSWLSEKQLLGWIINSDKVDKVGQAPMIQSFQRPRWSRRIEGPHRITRPNKTIDN